MRIPFVDIISVNLTKKEYLITYSKSLANLSEKEIVINWVIPKLKQMIKNYENQNRSC